MMVRPNFMIATTVANSKEHPSNSASDSKMHQELFEEKKKQLVIESFEGNISGT